LDDSNVAHCRQPIRKRPPKALLNGDYCMDMIA